MVALLVVAVVLATGHAFAAPRPRVLRLAGEGGGPDYAVDVAAGPGGWAFVTGSAYGGIDGGDDYLTVAYDPLGREAWVEAYDGPDSNIDQAAAVAVDPGGTRTFVTGYSFGGPATTNDVATVAYDAVTGQELWVARYDGPGHDTDAGTDVEVAPDGTSVYVSAASVGLDGSLDMLAVAYDAATGQELWVARSVGVPGGADEALALAVAPDGGRVIAAGYVFGATDVDLAVVAYDAADGSEAWFSTIDAGADELARAVAVDDRGRVFAAGARIEAPSDRFDGSRAWSAGGGGSCGTTDVLGWDVITVGLFEGAVRWAKAYDGPGHDCDEGYGVALDPEGHTVFVTGSSLGLDSGLDMATIAYSARSGQLLWTARYDGPAHREDRGGSIAVSPDGRDVFVTGTSVGLGTDLDYATVAYAARTGLERWADRYDGPASGFDAPNGMAVAPDGSRLFVTGGSTGPDGTPDYATLVYIRPVG